MFAKFTNVLTSARININPASVAVFEPTTQQGAQTLITLTSGLQYYVADSERTVRGQLTKAARSGSAAPAEEAAD